MRARFFLVAELVRGLHADEIHVRNGQQNRDEARAHRGDLCAHEVGEHEHHKTGRHACKRQIREDSLEALLAVGHPDHDKGDDENAEHVEPADHRGVERHGRYARVNQSRAAVDGGQARAAPGGRGCVAEKRNRDRRDRVKAEGYEERSRNCRRSARACRALEEDREHHADDDDLHAAIIADLRDRGLHVLNRARLAQKIQNDKRAEDHQHDLEAFF